MAKGELTHRGGGHRWRTKAAAAVAERRSDAESDSVSEDGADREQQAVRSVLRANAEKGYRELANVRQTTDMRSGVRGKVRSSKALVAPFRPPGAVVVVGATLNDILPRDLSKVTREDMAESLIHLAKKCEKIGNPAAAAQVMTKAAMVMGLFEEPEEVAAVDPEERKRKICEAAASYGMVMGPDKATK
jgi:hypothetical protein